MSPAPPRALVCGYGEMASVGLECLIESGFQVVRFVTHADDPAETIWWRPPAALARSRGIPVDAPARVASPADLGPDGGDVDFLFSFYYRRILPASVLAAAGRGALNLHGSLLPRYRGRAPVNWVLVNGETETGVTLHYMDERADHGDIVDQEPVEIAFEDTARTLFDRLAGAARVVLRRSLPALARGDAPRRPQDHARATTFGRRRPEDGRIDWRWPALKVYNLVRAVTHPYPGAFATLGGRRVFLWWATPLAGAPAGATAPGTVIGPGEAGVRVACGEGAILVRRAQAEGAPEIGDLPGLTALLPAGSRLA